MAKYILTDQRPKKGTKTNPETLFIPDIPAPEKNPVIYYDAHPDAPKGFALKATPAGSKKWILRYYVGGKERRMTLDKGHPAWGPKRARKEASNLKTSIVDGADPLEAKARDKQVKIDAVTARKAKADQHLGALLMAYVKQLEKQGKYSTHLVENALRRHVEKAHPRKWKTPADELRMRDFRDIVATLIEGGKYREAQKVRAYMRAAYSAAIKSHSDAAAVPELRKFNIETNPARDVAPVSKPKGYTPKLRKPLTLGELRCYWKRINALPDPDGAILRLHLLTGGQRLEQLCRLTAEDIDGDEIIMYDPKGAREDAREHRIPLLKEAQEALDAIGASPWLVSLDGGKNPANRWNVTHRVKAVAETMIAAEETEQAFTGKIIRSTVETRLTEAGISPHILAYLLSHGLGGIQERHYQFYDFGSEKLHALKVLRDLLTEKPAKVVPLREETA